MKGIWSRYLDYVSSYADECNADCLDKTFVLDMIYGIGISIDKDAYWGANGFDRFKTELREYMK